MSGLFLGAGAIARSAAMFAGESADLSPEVLSLRVEIDEIIRDLAALNGRTFAETEAWVEDGGAERLLERLEAEARR